MSEAELHLIRARDLHATGQACQSLGSLRLDKAVAAAFLEAVTPAGIAATAGAIHELEEQHDERFAGQRLAVERAEFDADRARRQFDACEPEHLLVARTLERTLEEALADVERERGKLVALEQARPAPLSDDERQALARLARHVPRLWDADSTTDRDRKQLLRTLIREVVVTTHTAERRADVEIAWEGGARTELSIRLNRRGPERRRIAEDTLELIRRLAQHHADRQIAQILSRQGRLTGTVAGQRAALDLDVDSSGPATLAAQTLEFCLVGGVGEGQVAREAAPVAAGQLAAVERDRDELRL